MARKPTPDATSKETPVDVVLIEKTFDAANQLATLQTQADEKAHALALQLGYEGSLTVGALEDGIRFYQQRTAEACMQLGVRLALLKQARPHGDFRSRLDLLGIEYGAASRFIGVASKFGKMPTSALLKAANSQSKLLELLVLDDSEIQDLEEGGSALGLTVDDVDRMGVRELRAKLREARAEKDADDKILADKNAKIDKLSRRIAKVKPDEVLAELQKEATAIANDAIGAVKGNLRQALIALYEHTQDNANAVFMAGLIGQVQRDLADLREEFDLPDVSNAADQQLAAETAQWASK